MTKTELKGLHQQLLAMGRRLRGQVSDASQEALRQAGGEASGGLSNVPNHPADLGSDTYEHEVAISVLENEGQLLDQIVTALDRIEQGTYGVCQECGQPIASERLHAVPYAACCVECARVVEARGAANVE